MLKRIEELTGNFYFSLNTAAHLPKEIYYTKASATNLAFNK